MEATAQLTEIYLGPTIVGLLLFIVSQYLAPYVVRWGKRLIVRHSPGEAVRSRKHELRVENRTRKVEQINFSIYAEGDRQVDLIQCELSASPPYAAVGQVVPEGEGRFRVVLGHLLEKGEATITMCFARPVRLTAFSTANEYKLGTRSIRARGGQPVFVDLGIMGRSRQRLMTLVLVFMGLVAIIGLSLVWASGVLDRLR